MSQTQLCQRLCCRITSPQSELRRSLALFNDEGNFYNILLYLSGAQKGCTDIANRVPIIETGIVEQSKPNNTEGN